MQVTVLPGKRLRSSARFNATTSDINFGASFPLLAPWSFLSYICPAGAGEGTFNYIWGKVPSAATGGPRCFLSDTAGAISLLTFGTDSVNTAGNPTCGFTPLVTAYNIPHHFGGSWNGNINASGNVLGYGSDGLGSPLSRLAESTTANGSGLTASGAANNFHIGNRQAADRTFNGSIAYLAFWNRVLSHNEFLRAQFEGPRSVEDGLFLCWANGQDYSPRQLKPTSVADVGLGLIPPAAQLLRRLVFVVTAIVASGVTINCTVGDAVANGSTATIGAATTISALVGNAVADGSTASVSNATAIEIFANYERSSVKLADSTVVGIGDSAVVSIKPRFQASEVTSSELRWLNPSAKVTGVNGYRPTFRFLSYLTSGSGAYHGQPWQAARRPMYSYDQVTWNYFDTAVTVDTGNNWIEFRHSAAFTGPTVYITRGRQVQVNQVGGWLDAWASAFPTIFVPTDSAVAFTPTLTAWNGQSFIANEFSSQTNELSEAIPATPFYAAIINDTSLMPLNGGPKRLAVISGGVHAGEDHGDYVLKAFIDSLLGANAWAQSLRRNYKVLVYPSINSPGRAGGGWRGSFTLGAGSIDDANRHFSDASPALEIITIPKAVMTTDRAGVIPDWMIDFHGTFSSSWSVFDDAGQPLQGLFRSRLGTYSGFTINDEGDTLAGFHSRYWQGLGAKLALTHESGDPSQVTDANITTGGDATVRAMDSMSVDGLLGVYPVVGDAVAAGSTATITTAGSIAGTVGNAVAAGSTAIVNAATNVSGLVGNAVAGGQNASISGSTTVTTIVGNASASGATATIGNNFEARIPVGLLVLPALHRILVRD